LKQPDIEIIVQENNSGCVIGGNKNPTRSLRFALHVLLKVSQQKL
jgi:hypothetical protein